jgi:hypothetical protein
MLKGGEYFMTFNYKLGGAVAIATFVATVLAPAGLAETTVDVSNNGALSHNTVNVTNGNGGSGSTTNQTNNSVIINTVSVNQNTGKNNASLNTGGGTTITTGAANSNVTVGVGGSTNTAVGTEGCGCSVGDTTVIVSDNGALSHNKVTVTNGGNSKYKKGNSQTNNSFIVNGVNVSQNTGKNKAKLNTGGSTIITTNDTNSDVTVSVTGSANSH